jgi:YD repeat-containing protein
LTPIIDSGTIRQPDLLAKRLIKSRTVTGNGVNELTAYDYDGVGQLKKATLPDGSWIGYNYDDAHRLTDTYDSIGNRIIYTLDAMGNRLKEEVKDPTGALARQVSRVYDALNRLKEVTGPANSKRSSPQERNGNNVEAFLMNAG